MLDKNKIYSIIAGLFFLASTPNIALAQKLETGIKVSAMATNKFQKIEQPLELKLAVLFGGLGLIGVELWWFMFSQTKSQKAQVKKDIY